MALRRHYCWARSAAATSCRHPYEGFLPQSTRWVRWLRDHRLRRWRRFPGRYFGWCWLWQTNALIHLQVLLAAPGAIALARVFVAQAGQLVATANAVAVAGDRCRLDGDKSHLISFDVDTTCAGLEWQPRRALDLLQKVGSASKVGRPRQLFEHARLHP